MSIAVRAKQIVIAWVDGKEGRSHVRVASWNGKGWSDVGNSRSGHLRLKYLARHPKIAALPNGDVLVAWIYRGQPWGALAVVQWSGKKWQLGSPFQAERQMGALMLALGKDTTPLLSWLSEDSGFNSGINVWQFGTQGWAKDVSELHLANTPSYITHADMAADKKGEVHLIWQEDQDQGATRHVVRVYPCEKGEVPKPIPQRPTRQSLWPQTVEAAATVLLDAVDSESKEKIRQTKKSELARFHFGWGMSIRNNLGLWMGNTALLASCGKGKVVDADSCSTIIVEHVWERLQH